MSDQTANDVRHHRPHRPTIEYRIYFAIIFVLSLPFTFVTCVLGLCRPDDEDANGKDFVTRAWNQASVITPLIFSQ
ncbi:MAG: cytochrome PufQ [Pseudomonadota bacterium]